MNLLSLLFYIRTLGVVVEYMLIPMGPVRGHVLLLLPEEQTFNFLKILSLSSRSLVHVPVSHPGAH